MPEAALRFLKLAYFKPHSVQFFVHLLLKISILVLVATYSKICSLLAIGFPLSHSTFRLRYWILPINSSTFYNLLLIKDKVKISFGNYKALTSKRSILSKSNYCSSTYSVSPSLTGKVFSSWYFSIFSKRSRMFGWFFRTFRSYGYLKVKAWSITKTFPFAGIWVLALTSKF